jgi:hypothetical protein
VVTFHGVSSPVRPLPSQVNAALARVAPSAVSRTRKRVALGIAALSDLVQWFFFPVLSEGALSPFEIALDAVTALLILVVVGFQWRLLIALAAELVPGLDMFPTWTAVVLSLPSTPASVPPPSPSKQLPR